MDGFKRPVRRPTPPPAHPAQQTGSASKPAQQLPVLAPEQPEAVTDTLLEPVSLNDTQSLSTKKKRPVKRIVAIILAALVLLVILAIFGFMAWYGQAVEAADKNDNTVVKVEVKDNSSLSSIANTLQVRGVIKSAFAFTLYARLNGQQNALKAGTCNLKPSESVQEILDKLTAGCHDFKVVTFFPGATIDTSLYAKTHAAELNQEFADPSIRASLKNAGYSAGEIDTALAASYDSPLFAGKPAGTGYEGYIFGETYYVDQDASAQDVLKTAFDHMYQIVQQDDLVAKFKVQGLNLYQGITLSSIVEKELDCEGKPTEERKQRCYGYQQQIARVFLNRLKLGMSLGSDVTFIYAADRLGVAPSVDVTSPYNTRKVTGLPPGPIASPGELALRSVANPATSDDLFFLAGDDGLIYFAKDDAGHEQNIREHCQEGCGGAV